MGKQKMNKRKKKQISFIYSPLALIESKEAFIENLIHIFSSYQRVFQNSIKARGQRKLPMPITNLHLSLKEQKCEYFNQIDESREFHHIFYYHLHKFLSNLTSMLSEFDDLNHQLIIPCVNDAFLLLEVVQTDLEKITNFLFESTVINCKRIILIIFHDLIEGKFVQRINKEDNFKDEDFLGFNQEGLINDGFTVKTARKRRRNKFKKFEDLAEMDEEIFLFQQRILNEKNQNSKQKPNVSQEWIQSLKKALKTRLI